MKHLKLFLILLFSSSTILHAAKRTSQANGNFWNRNIWTRSNNVDPWLYPNDLFTINRTMTTGNTRNLNVGGMPFRNQRGSLSMADSGPNKEKLTINNGGSLTVTSNFYISGGTVTVKNGGTLNINGSMSLGNNGRIVVEPGGTLNVGLNVAMQSNARVNLAGTNSIGGNVTIAGSGTEFNLNSGELDLAGSFRGNQDGILRVNGNMSANRVEIHGSAKSFVNGELNITNLLSVRNNGSVRGRGTVSWGSISVNPGNSGAYIGCLGTPTVKHDTNGATGFPPPPGEPLNLTTCSEVLPIELLSFEGIFDENKVFLNWTTMMEYNNDYFSIERSNNLKNWENIAKIDGSLNSYEILEYSFIDEHLMNDKPYYRLKQTDIDGKFTYSDIISIAISEGKNIKIFPNPSSTGIFNIEINSKHYQKYTIHDMRSLKLDEIKIDNNLLTIDLTKYASGIYLINFYSKNGIETHKIIIL